ncbi:hypothetical protein HBI26_041640 [Parastagonospora nodorum]|nr:hypothetical protein HBH69_039490 [Parastagonospora nodorum]KAH5435103.1 hypothetical protein HBI47_081060 [Parastagonospora nodorum]KAH5607323.1 hypothetical protein HBI26_041640 [Parastagonospora nodorum]
MASEKHTLFSTEESVHGGGTLVYSKGAIFKRLAPAKLALVLSGTNGVLGSGTNAPLYTSTFLNRADPEAELAAYERRLALALDVDQTDRILQHSPLPTAMCKSMQNEMAKHAKPAWRDGAWIKDGVILSLSTCASIVYFWVLLTIQ